MISCAVIIFGVGLLVSALVTALMKRLAPRLRLMDQPSARKVHTQPKPKGGGIGIFAGTIGPVVAGYLGILILGHFGVSLPTFIQAEVPRLHERLIPVALILGGGGVLVALGLADDLRGLSVALRLGVEFAVAAALFLFTNEVRITFFEPHQWMWFVLTVFWIVGITNSFNLLDNMDGLSSGVGLIVSVLLLAVAILTGQYLVAAILLAFMGSLLGFLMFNFPPASVFMGDAGSLFIGYFLAVITTACTFTTYHEGNIVAALVPLLILAVPLYDTATVVWIRLRAGRSIFSADKNHLSHRLVAMGFTQRDAVLVIYLLTFCCGVGATLINQLGKAGAIIVLVQVLGVLVLVGLLEHTGRQASRQASDGVDKAGNGGTGPRSVEG